MQRYRRGSANVRNVGCIRINQHSHHYIPRRPWARIHIDHAGPFQGKLFLVVVDAHSKLLETVIVPSTATIKALRPILANHGLVVSDNDTQPTDHHSSLLSSN